MSEDKIRLDPEIAKSVLSGFSWRERETILDAVRLGNKSQNELETWGLFCACLTWGGLEAKRDLLMNFYRKISKPFLQFLRDPSTEPLTVIYPGKGVNQLPGVCLAIKDIINEFGSLSEFSKNQKDVVHCIFGLANTLRRNLDKHHSAKKFNLPKVKSIPPFSSEEKKRTGALKRYCMYLRWMVRDEEPDFGVWNFFDKKDLFHPIDTHVSCILKRWRVLSDEKANWFNVEKVTKYFREVEPDDPTKFDYHLVTFGQKFCKKKGPLCWKCPVNLEFKFKCILAT